MSGDWYAIKRKWLVEVAVVGSDCGIHKEDTGLVFGIIVCKTSSILVDLV